jgi:hypothetical protein
LVLSHFTEQHADLQSEQKALALHNTSLICSTEVEFGLL